MLDMHHRVAGKVLAARLSVAVSVLNLVEAPSHGRFGVAGSTCHLAVGPSLPYIFVGISAVATWANANPYLENLGLELLEQSQTPKGFWPAFSQMISTEFGVSFTGAIWTAARPAGKSRITPPRQGIANIVTALLPVILTSDTSCQLARRLILALQSGDMTSDDPLSSVCT